MATIPGGTPGQQGVKELFKQMQERHMTHLLSERMQHPAYLIC